MPKRGSLKNMKVLRMGFGREDICKTKKETMENKRGNPFLKGFPFCEVSSGVEPLYTVLQTVT